jgi:hypothetical protein
MATSQELLTQVESAIEARLTGGAVQSYSIGGRNIQYISLTELYKLRDKLKREVQASSPTNTRLYATFAEPR